MICSWKFDDIEGWDLEIGRNPIVTGRFDEKNWGVENEWVSARWQQVDVKWSNNYPKCVLFHKYHNVHATKTCLR